MKIRITEQTPNGRTALSKLRKEKTWGVAKKNVISEEPLTIEIEPKGLGRLASPMLKLPQVKATIESNMIEMMGNYGAKKKDYSIEVL